jgi:hypothetical protein
MLNILNVVSYILFLSSFLLAYRWYLNPHSNYEPILTGLSIVGAVISKYSSQNITLKNNLKINGNGNATIQSIGSNRVTDLGNKTEIIGDNNITEQKIK